MQKRKRISVTRRATARAHAVTKPGCNGWTAAYSPALSGKLSSYFDLAMIPVSFFDFCVATLSHRAYTYSRFVN